MTFKTTNIERIYIYAVVQCPGEFFSETNIKII